MLRQLLTLYSVTNLLYRGTAMCFHHQTFESVSTEGRPRGGSQGQRIVVRHFHTGRFGSSTLGNFGCELMFRSA